MAAPNTVPATPAANTNTSGLATSSSWNDSGFAFAPNTNTLDSNTMPSAEAQKAREKSAEIMAALKAGDTNKANALMGKDQSGGKIIPGMGWLKKKLDRKGSKKVEEGKGKVVEDSESEYSAVRVGEQKEMDGK